MWDLEQTLEIIFPWEYLSDDKICTAAGWEGVNWILQIEDWGNDGMKGPSFGGESPLGGGPSGFLNKGEVNNRKRELEALGWMCQGIDTTRCAWPAGIYSGVKPYCAPGFNYSYESNQCFASPFGKAECSCTTGCQPTRAGACGGAYLDVCSGSCLTV